MSGTMSDGSLQTFYRSVVANASTAHICKYFRDSCLRTDDRFGFLLLSFPACSWYDGSVFIITFPF